MKRLLLWTLVLLAVLLPGFTPAAAQGSLWTAEYFNNTSLIGPAALVRTESSPTNEWGYGSPGPGVLADNFSGRWTTTTFLNAGSYQISVRADDGIRVYVDGVPYINEWHLATGQLYQVTVTLAAGNHTIVVEFFEAAEVAFVVYNFTLISGGPPPGSPQATVTAQFLNVRSLPNPSAAILVVISRGQVYPVVGRNFNTSWLQLNVNGATGWVNSSYVTASNIAGVPVTDGGGPYPTPIPPPPVGATATVTAYLLNVRNAPNPFTGGVITQITRGQIYPVIGRNLDTSWVQINVNGLIGWVRSSWTALANIGSVPVTSNTTNPAPNPIPINTFATVRAYFLNVRSQPFATAPVLTLISQGQTYPVVGRNASNTWVQVNISGTLGWVRSTWVIVVPNLSNVPVTG